MNPKTVLLVFLSSNLLAVLVHVDGQSLNPDGGDTVTNFQPSLAVVIGILSIMFSLTFLLLLYAKFCHRRGSAFRTHHQNPDDVARSASGLSGIDKSVVKSLPFFRFSVLRGSREGLECAVCLSRFEDVEVLRLLPKCKHAFHVDCVDRWLEKHSSCPLCRHRVSADDVAVFAGSESLRFLADVDEQQREGSSVELELFVRREEDRYGSSRFCVGSSFRRIEIEKGIENCQEITVQDQDREDRRLLFEKGIENSREISISIRDHRDREDRRLLFGQEFGPSEVVFKNRWSNVSSSDLMFLESEMINEASSKIFSELGSSSNSNPRSVSDITAISRFGGWRSKNRAAGESCLGHENVRETNARKIWLPIAKKTVEWFADREKKNQLQESENTNQEPKTLLV